VVGRKCATTQAVISAASERPAAPPLNRPPPSKTTPATGDEVVDLVLGDQSTDAAAQDALLVPDGTTNSTWTPTAIPGNSPEEGAQPEEVTMPMSAGMLYDRWDSCRERLKYGLAHPYSGCAVSSH
jgi:hypothetical protein